MERQQLVFAYCPRAYVITAVNIAVSMSSWRSDIYWWYAWVPRSIHSQMVWRIHHWHRPMTTGRHLLVPVMNTVGLILTSPYVMHGFISELKPEARQWLPRRPCRLWKSSLILDRPSVRLSVCGRNRVRSVPSTKLARSISYLHILSTNFRRCGAFDIFCWKIPKLEFLSISLNL